MTLDQMIERLMKLRRKHPGHTKTVVGTDFEIKEIDDVEHTTRDLGRTIPMILIQYREFE